MNKAVDLKMTKRMRKNTLKQNIMTEFQLFDNLYVEQGKVMMKL